MDIPHHGDEKDLGSKDVDTTRKGNNLITT